MGHKKWIQNPDKPETVRDIFLNNMKVKDIAEINDWFSRSAHGGFHIDRLNEAAALIMKFQDKRVTIVGDYDADGICSSTTLYLMLRHKGFKDVHIRIPKRFSEGFGLSEKIVDEIPDGLIITCDNGIAFPSVIQKAKDKGLTVIVTDHHQPTLADGKPVYPNADVIIDPAAVPGSADFTGYCGAGICYRLAKALLGEGDPYLKTLLPFAGIATITDVVDLREENYVFAHNAFPLLTSSRELTTGLWALVNEMGCQDHVTATDIGFSIGPVLNASSRMKDDGAIDAVRLLTFEGAYAEATGMAHKLRERNDVRKGLKRKGLSEAHRLIAEEGHFDDMPLILNIPNVEEGILGIIAGNLAEEFRRPAIVVSEHDGILRGSARSYKEVNEETYVYSIKAELDKASDYLLKYGGHPGAAGFSIDPAKFDDFVNVMQENGKAYDFSSPAPDIWDIEVTADQASEIIQEIDKYEPWGQGNPMPIFKVTDFTVVPRNGKFKTPLGDGSIIKMFSKNLTAVGFGMADEMADIENPKNLILYGKLSDNYFNGNVEPQIEFLDFEENHPVETDFAALLKTKASM